MTKKRRAHDRQAWTNAKKCCQLTARQVDMARALGMNPRKLPRLRPSPQQRWKLPVGEFIEECYRQRFGGDARDQHARGHEQQSRKLLATNLEVNVPERVRDPACQLSDLACYLVNLADDLQQWLVHGSIDPEVLPQVRAELRAIAQALDTGAPISPIPATMTRSHSDRRRRVATNRRFVSIAAGGNLFVAKTGDVATWGFTSGLTADDRSILCWGDNRYGALGNGSTDRA